MFKKNLIVVIANNQEDVCKIVDVARDYAKSYRIGVYGDKKNTLVSLYISRFKFKRLIKKLSNDGYGLFDESNNYIFTMKKS